MKPLKQLRSKQRKRNELKRLKVKELQNPQNLNQPHQKRLYQVQELGLLTKARNLLRTATLVTSYNNKISQNLILCYPIDIENVIRTNVKYLNVF